MSIHIGDTILVNVNMIKRIGVLEYIGYIDSNHQSKFVGVNLIESIENGHNGSINGVRHFKAPRGHGIYVRIENIIRKLNCTEIALKMQEIIILFKQRLTEYITALSERDEYIQELKNSKRRLKKLLNKSKNNPLHQTIKELTTSPVPILYMKMKKNSDESINIDKNEKVKHSEYTKYSATDGNLTWCDDGDYHSSEELKKPTPISISIQSKNKQFMYRQKSHSAHNTPQQSPIVNAYNHQTAVTALPSQPSFSPISPYNHNINANCNQQQQQQQQQLYGMLAQQQNMMRLQHGQPFHDRKAITKRRSLNQIKPIPELRQRHSKRREIGLKLQNRRSNSVDMGYDHYVYGAQLFKNQRQHENHLKNKTFRRTNQQQQYRNKSLNEQIYPATDSFHQRLTPNHFSAYC